MGRAYDSVKRATDLVVGAIAAVVAAPVLALAAILIRLTMGRPVLFRDERAGRGGEPFSLVKLRTMRAPDPAGSGPEHDAARLTRVGRVLRAGSLDELPAIWNVLRGDMSLVGPRPLPTRYLPRYTPEQARRHEVRPGITGWAQVNGRNAIGWDQKFALDVWYVDNRSAPLDLRILARTAVAVLRREGISHGGHATMPEFGGPASP